MAGRELKRYGTEMPDIRTGLFTRAGVGALVRARHAYHRGTISAMAGGGLAGPAIKLLGRDPDRMQGDIRISRR